MPNPPRRPTRGPAAVRAEVGSATPHLFRPTPERPVRAKQRRLRADTLVVPHRHPWPQLTTTAGEGVIRLSTASGTIIVPPQRAVWVPAGMEHSIDVVEDAELLTAYLHDRQPAADACWSRCLVLETGPLLRALLQSLDTRPDADGHGTETTAALHDHESLVAPLLQRELARAAQLPLGVPLPDAASGDKRLRALCQAVLRAPARGASLAQWAAEAGASERTAARLFRSELGLSWQQWRRQALLAHALPLLARGLPVAHVAAASGYASDSAFIAMFRAAMGRSPRHFRPGAGTAA